MSTSQHFHKLTLQWRTLKNTCWTKKISLVLIPESTEVEDGDWYRYLGGQFYTYCCLFTDNDDQPECTNCKKWNPTGSLSPHWLTFSLLSFRFPPHGHYNCTRARQVFLYCPCFRNSSTQRVFKYRTRTWLFPLNTYMMSSYPCSSLEKHAAMRSRIDCETKEGEMVRVKRRESTHCLRSILAVEWAEGPVCKYKAHSNCSRVPYITPAYHHQR